jgi:outer membrane protein assembly factor BamB
VSGATRWRKRLGRLAWYNWEDTENSRRHWLGLRLTVGPDLDRDGRREVFVAARLKEEQGFTAAALSGRDGRILWRSTPRASESDGPASGISLLRWWQTGSDGHPQLVIPYQRSFGAGSAVSRPTLYVLETGTGRSKHVIPEFGDPRVADLDGDGVPDLYAFRTNRKEEVGTFESDTAGHVAFLRGTPPELWRRFGTGRPASDFDGDGLADVFLNHFDSRGRVTWWLGDGPRTINAVSGRTGELLWRATVGTPYRVLPLKADLDGDGHPDLLSTTLGGTPAVAAVSGKTGKTLWSLARWPEGGQPINFTLLGCFDLGRGSPLVVGSSFVEGKSRLVALDGRTGRLKWHTPGTFAEGARVAVADLNGDSVGDLLFWSFDVLRAVNGLDGKVLWTWKATHQSEEPSARVYGIFHEPLPTVGNGGHGTVVVVPYPQGSRQRVRHGVVLLDGKDGMVKGRWQGEEFNPGRVLAASPWGSRQPIPRLVRLGGRLCICAAVLEGKDRPGWQLVLLEQRGDKLEVRQRRALIQPVLGNGGFFHFWVYDRGDGSDGILVGEQGKLLALHGGVEAVAWQGPPLANVADLLDREAGNVVVRVGGTVLGLDGRTGRVLWRCSGPGKFVGLLKSSKPGTLPRVLFEEDQTTICRIPLKVDTP